MGGSPEPAGLWERIEKYSPLITILAFILGIFLASISTAFGETISGGVSGFIDIFGILAPIVIFAIVAPCLAKVLHIQKGGAFGAYAVLWLSTRRFLACIWAVVFTVIIFGFPLLPTGVTNIGAALSITLSNLANVLLFNPYMIALWAAIAVAFLSRKSSTLYRALERVITGIESSGKYLEPLIPLFMLAIGAYVFMLPQYLAELTEVGASLQTVNVMGVSIDPNTPWGMVSIYVVAALLVALACIIWHMALLGWVKKKVKGFSIRNYFSRYWIRVYPLLWATSSEALAMPLNLHLVKKHFKVRASVRRFVIGIGSYLNINGTMICVFVLAGAVAAILGYPISLLEFLIAVPLIYLIGFGVPGIPGELLLFAGPLVVLLNIPTAIAPAFLALYLGLQLGLPDSFRTGNNSTDDAAFALLLNDVYDKKFAGRGKK